MRSAARPIRAGGSGFQAEPAGERSLSGSRRKMPFFREFGQAPEPVPARPGVRLAAWQLLHQGAVPRRSVMSPPIPVERREPRLPTRTRVRLHVFDGSTGELRLGGIVE